MKKSRDNGARGFTLVELMVVVAIVGILIAGVFQLMSTVGKINQKSATIARMQRVQNAISGFYAEYGYYPPVAQYASPDPWDTAGTDDFGMARPDATTEAGFAAACISACAAQPVAFEYPPPKGLDKEINRLYQQWGIQSANSLLGSSANQIKQDDWKNVKIFKFGLLSYLLPRVEQVGFAGIDKPESDLEPNKNFFMCLQWKNNNPTSEVADPRKSLETQQSSENRAVSRWLPNLENAVLNGRIILGIDTSDNRAAGLETASFRAKSVTDAKGKIIDMLGYKRGGGDKYVLQFVSLRDGWNRELYYYSAPPYQSYRLWSAGADGRTFPPWIPISTLSSKERAWASAWVKDDIVRFDQ